MIQVFLTELSWWRMLWYLLRLKEGSVKLVIRILIASHTWLFYLLASGKTNFSLMVLAYFQPNICRCFVRKTRMLAGVICRTSEKGKRKIIWETLFRDPSYYTLHPHHTCLSTVRHVQPFSNACRMHHLCLELNQCIWRLPVFGKSR